MTKKALQTVGALALLALAFAACSTTGYVLEEGSNKPIDGAYVVVEWTGRVYTPAGGTSVRHGLEVTQTDRDGKYTYSSFFRPRAFLGTASVEFVYKPGFHRSEKIYSEKNTNTHLLAPNAGTQEKRFKQIGAGFHSNCEIQSNPNKLLPVLKGIYEEKRATAINEQQKNEAEDRWLSEAEYCEFGASTANVNAEKRRETRQRVIGKGNTK